MSNTTQILFNSPALHSLKRDQLVKLCKIHSIKASGKNVELIEKLKQHALTLQSAERDDAAMEGVEESAQLNLTPQSDPADEEPALNHRQLPRPSEQWEVVMDSIEEVDEGSGSAQNSVSSKGTLRTLNSGSSTTVAGEFGTGSSKSSSVTSSIKALATSLGLNRAKSSSSKANMSTSTSETSFMSVPSSLPSLPNTIKKRLDMDEELVAASMPYSSIPESSNPPQTDHLTFVPPSPLPGTFVEDTHAMIEDTTPLPGHPLRPGQPAPSAPDARLSLGLNTPARGTGPTTTIRLVSGSAPNAAALFKDTDKGNRRAGGWGDSTWKGGDTPKLKPFATSFDLVLGSPGPIYPPLPLDDLIASQLAKPSQSPKAAPTAGLVAAGTTSKASSSKTSLSPPRPAPFVFGSPLPQHRLSNAQFQDAAKNVLEEMNKRLADEGVQSVSTDVLNTLDPSRRVDLSSALNTTTSSPTKNHEAERMKVRQKFDRAHEEAFSKMASINEPIGAGRKRKSNVLMERSERRASAGVRKRSSIGVGIRQGGIGVHRTSGVRVISGGRRKAAKTLPGGFGDDDDSASDDDGDQGEVGDQALERGGKRVKVEDDETAKRAREEEEARKTKEQENIKRKLERNKAARRSSIVAARESVGRGRASMARNAAAAPPKPKPSRFGFLSSAKNLVTGIWKGKAAKVDAPVHTTTGIPVSTKSTPVVVQPSAAPAPKVVAGHSVIDKKAPSGSSSSRDFSGYLKPAGTDRASTVKSTTSARSRSPIPSFGATAGSASGTYTSSASSAATKGTGVRQSSVGTRTSAVGSTVNSVGTRGTSKVSSMGVRNNRTSIPSESVQADSKSPKSSLPRLASRPSTVSRLMAPTASSLAKIHARGSTTGLDTVKEKENHPRPTLGIAMTTSPRPGIFSKHLSPSPSLSGIPSPIKTGSFTSLGAAAASIASTSTKDATDPMTKPRSLNGRKPRISRSKVIAKLASQRAAASSSGKTLRPSLDAGRAGKTRSSLGAKAQRESLGGALKNGKGEAVLMAKRRARASEYARRKSLKVNVNTAMNVDD